MTILLKLSTTTGAIADGKDKNTITSLVMNGNEYVSGEIVVLGVTDGTAVFPNGSPEYVVKTNLLGSGSTFLTSTQAGEATVTAHLNSDPNVTNKVNCRFSGAEQHLTISLSTISDNALADGTMANKVKAQVKNSNGSAPPDGTMLKFFLSGNAFFPNHSNTFSAQPDVDGTVTVSFYDKTAQSVELLAYIIDYNAVPQDIISTFIGGSGNVNVMVDILQNHAEADGTSANTLLVKTTDTSGVNDIGNVRLFAEIMDYDGAAVFDNKKKLISFTTNASGSYLLNLSSSVSFPVIVNIYDDDLVKKNTTSVGFTRKTVPDYLYLVSSVYERRPISSLTFTAGTSQTVYLISSVSDPVTLTLKGGAFFSSSSNNILIFKPETNKLNPIEIVIPADASQGSFTISIDFSDYRVIDSGKINGRK